jgi:hypothetical protein
MSRAPGKYVAGAMVPAGAALDRPDLNTLFLIQIFMGSKSCPLLETSGLRVPALHIRDFCFLNVPSSSKNFPSTRWHGDTIYSYKTYHTAP